MWSYVAGGHMVRFARIAEMFADLAVHFADLAMVLCRNLMRCLSVHFSAGT
jgi:hypothetical protein